MRVLYQWLIMASDIGTSWAFAAPFVEDADFITSDGTLLTGRDAIASQRPPLLLKGRPKGSHPAGHISRVRFLGPDVAILYAVGDTAVPERRSSSNPCRAFHELVAKRAEEGWRIVALHETRIRPFRQGIRASLISTLADWLRSVSGAARRDECIPGGVIGCQTSASRT